MGIYFVCIFSLLYVHMYGWFGSNNETKGNEREVTHLVSFLFFLLLLLLMLRAAVSSPCLSKGRAAARMSHSIVIGCACPLFSVLLSSFFCFLSWSSLLPLMDTMPPCVHYQLIVSIQVSLSIFFPSSRARARKRGRKKGPRCRVVSTKPRILVPSLSMPCSSPTLLLPKIPTPDYSISIHTVRETVTHSHSTHTVRSVDQAVGRLKPFSIHPVMRTFTLEL